MKPEGMSGTGNTRPRTGTISAVLFSFVIVELIAEDLLDLFVPGTDVQAAVSGLPPHSMFHVLTAALGFFGVAAILGVSIAFGPYRRGERWAWWSLLLADLAVILANFWGTLTIYAHAISNGLIPELLLPVALVALAVLLSWRDFNSSTQAAA
jgi:hypothetical protein